MGRHSRHKCETKSGEICMTCFQGALVETRVSDLEARMDEDRERRRADAGR